MNRLIDVLKKLNSRHSVSGSKIAKELGITRAAVWRRIKHLQQLGLCIISNPGKGYRLGYDFEKLDSNAIQQSLGKKVRIDVVWETSSTNTEVFSNIDKVELPRVLIAEYQHEGRGRRNDRWLSPLGSGLCMSLGWKFQSLPPTIPSLGLVVGLAIVDTLEKLGCTSIKIKWPNDVFFDGKKIAGCLIDLKTELSGSSYAVIGIGINISLDSEIKASIDQPVADLCDVLDSKISRNRLAGKLVGSLIRALETFEKTGFKSFRDKFLAKDLLYGKKITINIKDEKPSGYAAGVDWDGALLLDVDGRIRRFYTGHVTIVQ